MSSTLSIRQSHLSPWPIISDFVRSSIPFIFIFWRGWKGSLRADSCCLPKGGTSENKERVRDLFAWRLTSDHFSNDFVYSFEYLRFLPFIHSIPFSFFWKGWGARLEIKCEWEICLIGVSLSLQIICQMTWFNVVLQLNPTKMEKGADTVINLKQLLEFLFEAIEAIFNSANNCPV